MHVGTLRSLHRYPFKSMAGEDLDDCQVGAGGLADDRTHALRDERVGELRGAKHWPVLMTCSARRTGDTVEVTLPSGEQLNADDPALPGKLSALIGTPVSVWPLRPKSDLAHYRRAQTGARVAGVLARSKAARRALQRAMELSGQDAELREMFGREPGEALPDLSGMPPEIFEYTSPPGTYFDAFPIHLLTTATLANLAERQPEADWNPRRFRPNFVIETPIGTRGPAELAWAGRRLRIGEVVLEIATPTPRCSMIMQPQPGVGHDPRVLRTVVREADHIVGLYARVSRAGRVRAGDPVELL